MNQQRNLQELMEDVPVVTANDVIAKRQTAISTRIFEVEGEIYELTQRLEALKRERAELVMEHDMWARFDERNMVRTVVSTTTTVEVSGRMTHNDRMHFEDTLKAIMRSAGRPLQIADIRNRLASHGITWNSYSSAHNYITKDSGLLEGAGKRGFYQLIRP